MIPLYGELLRDTLLGGNVQAASAAYRRVVQEHAEGQYLVEIDAYKGDQIVTGARPTLMGEPLMSFSLLSTPSAPGNAGLVNLRYADRHWVGPHDDVAMAHTYYEGRVVSPLILRRAIPVVPEDGPRIRREFGEIALANGDGALDAIVRGYAVDGRRVRVRFGPFMGRYSDFQVVADLLATGWQTDGDVVRLSVRDWTFLLDRPLQTELYGGTGGADGTSELEGKPKPLLFGRCRNVTPPLVDPTNLVWQVHDGSVEAIDEVFERGASIPLDTTAGTSGDLPDYASLIAASIGSGKFATCKAEGLFRLGSQPSGLITADVRGDSTGGYVDTVDAIALRILRERVSLSESRINRSTFSTLGNAVTGTVGIYIDHQERPSTSEVMDWLIRGVAGYWGTGRDGRIRAGRIPVPETSSPVYALDEYNMIDLRIEQQPIPRYRQLVAWRPNWTPQQVDLAATVTADRRQFLTEKERSVATTDLTILARHINAYDPPVMASLFDDAADAQALADRQMELHKRGRFFVRARVSRLQYLFDLGQVLSVKWPRHGLEAGRNMVLVGVDADAAADSADLILWG